MISYFMRRILGSLVALALLTPMLYTFVVYSPGGVIDVVKRLDRYCRLTSGSCPVWLIEDLQATYELNKPWPSSYFAWLFNPDDVTAAGPHYDSGSNLLLPGPKGIEIAIGDLQIKGSGVLTGDLGLSSARDQGRPVADVLGPGLDLIFAALMALIFALMLTITLQRWRRPIAPFQFQRPPAFKLTDIYLHQIALISIKPTSRAWSVDASRPLW